MSVKVLLQLLIGIVYTKLLKRVILEHFEPKYVQDTDRFPLMRPSN